MRISELAGLTGVTSKTIRFYEDEGILPAPARSPNGYRRYDDVDLCRLRMIVTLRSLGLELAESGRLAGLCAAGRCDVMTDDLVVRLAERRREIAAAQAGLAHLDAELVALQDSLATDDPARLQREPGCCIGKEVDDGRVRLPVWS